MKMYRWAMAVSDDESLREQVPLQAAEIESAA